MNGFSSELEELIAALEELLNTPNVALILRGTGEFEFTWPNNYRNGSLTCSSPLC